MDNIPGEIGHIGMVALLNGRPRRRGDLEDGAGVGDLLEGRILTGWEREITVFTLRESSVTLEGRLTEETET